MPILTLFWLLLSFPIGAISSGRHKFCPIIIDRRARMLCHLRDGCRDLLQSSVSKSQGHVKSRKPLSLPADTPKRKHWERRDVSIERVVPAHKLAFRQNRHRVHFSQKPSNPRYWDFAISSLRFSQSKCFALLPNKRGWHLEGMTPSGLWDCRRWDLVTWLAVLALCCSLPSRTFPLCSLSYSAFLNFLICPQVGVNPTLSVTRKSIILIKTK